MSAGKQTPRQKMINMMYLVLTALLALNVSKEILNAFTLVEGGLRKTNVNFANKNNVIYDAFDKALQEFPEKTKPYSDAAFTVKRKSEELFNYIEELKVKMVKKVDGEEGNLDNIEGKDNADIPAEMMITKLGGKELKGKIADYRDLVTSFVPDDIGLQESIKKALDTTDPPVSEDGTKENWESQRFEGIPFIAVVTLLTQMQSDIRNAESDIITKLHEKIDAGSFKFNKLESTVIPVSNYVFTGDSYRADVFFAAFDTTLAPEIYIGKWDTSTLEMVGEYDSIKVVGGKGKYRAAANTPGAYEWGGIIKFKKTDGTYLRLPFQHEYQVAKPALVVSPTAMNVFYRGIKNPLEVSVPGVPLDKLEVSISNLDSRSGSNGQFEVNPGSGKECVVSVSATINGQKKNFGSKEFRVKRIPDPTPRFADATASAKVTKAKLLGSNFVTADMGDFLFDIKTPVVSFSLTATVKGELATAKSDGYKVTDKMKELLKFVKSGGKVYIEDIKAKTPDGDVRSLGVISITVI